MTCCPGTLDRASNKPCALSSDRSYDNDSWDESLSAAEYDTTFLALRTIKDRDGEQWSQTKLEVQLELTDQLAKAVQNNEADSARELIRTTEPSKEVEA